MNFSAEQAVVDYFVNDNPVGLEVNPASVRVLQSLPWDDSSIVLVSFPGQNKNAVQETCLFLYEVEKGRIGWYVGGGGGGCSSPGAGDQPIEIQAGGHSGSDFQFKSYIYGLVYRPDITAVQVTWDDGDVQQVEVIQESYMLVKADSHNWTLIRALNAAGGEVFKMDGPPLPPEVAP